MRSLIRWRPLLGLSPSSTTRHGGGLFRKRTHEGWDERVDAIKAELPLIAAVRSASGAADWAVHFRREIEP